MIVENDEMILFWSTESIYSNFHPVEFNYRNIHFMNSEAAYMYEKAKYFGDSESALKIIENQDPYTAKKLGRKVKGYDDVEWSKVRYKIMTNVLYSKFGQNKAMCNELLSTGNKLIVEASPYDKIWGIGLQTDDPLALDPSNWQGENLLGKAIMEVRLMLASEKNNE